jgi:8-oxo-dGTP diphosphatase
MNDMSWRSSCCHQEKRTRTETSFSPGPASAHRLSGQNLMMTPSPPAQPLAYKIAVLVFIENAGGEQLLLLRAKAPNFGVWSPIGGKLETTLGESPFECAVRETAEETGFAIQTADLHLFAMIAEKAYEGQAHWLLFLFRCRPPIGALPPDIPEGRFGFFSRTAIDRLPIPETDRSALWPIYDRYRDRFVALKADCQPGRPVQVEIEEIVPPATSPNRA